MRCFFLRDDRLADVEILPPGLSDEDAIARALTRSSNREGPFNAVEIWDGRRIVFRGCLSEATSGDGRPRGCGLPLARRRMTSLQLSPGCARLS